MFNDIVRMYRILHMAGCAEIYELYFRLLPISLTSERNKRVRLHIQFNSIQSLYLSTVKSTVFFSNIIKIKSQSTNKFGTFEIKYTMTIYT